MIDPQGRPVPEHAASFAMPPRGDSNSAPSLKHHATCPCDPTVQPQAWKLAQYVIVFSTWRQIRESPQSVLRGHALKRLIGDSKRRCPGHSKTPAGSWPLNAGSTIRQSNHGTKRSLPLATGQGTRGASEFIMKSSKSSKLAKRNSCSTEPTSPLRAALASAAQPPSSASWIASKHLSKFADRSFG